MSDSINFGRRILLSLALGACSAIAIADDCGTAPQVPSLVDGAKATMEELVATSQGVKTYIADADKFLDCRESIAKGDGFKEMSADDQKAFLQVNTDVLNSRNGIGDAFNAEVAEYKAANP